MASVINQIELDKKYALAHSAYAECSTSASTQAKAATICTGGDTTNTAFTLIKGVTVTVKFTTTNTAASPTLSINGTAAKAIYYNGEAVPADYIKANCVYTFVYNGSSWDVVGHLTNTYTKAEIDAKYVTAGRKSGTDLGAGATAEGSETTSSGYHSHAEGGATTASGNQSHAEGYETVASGDQAHAEGYGANAKGKFSHAEGFNTETGKDADGAHAQGKFTKALGSDSAANGYWTIAESSHQFVIGHVNDNKETNLFEIGGGAVYYEKSNDYTTADPDKFDRFNVFEVSNDGQAKAESFSTKDTIINREGVSGEKWHNGPSGAVAPKILPGAIASGFQSVAFGGQRIDKAKAGKSVEDEPQTQALGDQSFAAGGGVIVEGEWSAGFGKESKTYQRAAFATGGGTQAGCTAEEYKLNNTYMHASGATIPDYAESYSFGHAEGDSSKAIGRATHAEGRQTLAIGFCSHAEGDNTKAIGRYSHAEGYQSTTGIISSSSGKITLAASYAHAEGQGTKAHNTATHSEGISTTANGIAAHAEGYNTTAGILNRVDADGKNIIDAAHAEGTGTIATGISSHAEGNGTQATHDNAHAEGSSTKASNTNAHAEGLSTTASGLAAHSEGHYSQASGNYSHTEGDQTVANGLRGHAEGYKTLAKGSTSHAEGYSHNKCTSSLAVDTIKANWENSKNFTAAVGTGSHAEGLDALAYGEYSHAGGSCSGAIGNNSFAHGDHVVASVANQVVFGKYNAEDSNTLFIVGNGTADKDRKNVFTVNKNGTALLNNRLITTEIIPVTYSELVALRNSAALVPGAFYRITDYSCATTQADTRAINSYNFDIIVQALSSSALSEIAQATPVKTNRLVHGAVKAFYRIEEDVVTDADKDDSHTGDEFIAYGYLKNNSNQTVPVLYKTDMRGGQDFDPEPDYADCFFYVGTQTVDGVSYDKWRKIETGTNGGGVRYTWTSTGSVHVLTNLIVKNNTISDNFIRNDSLTWELKYCLDNDTSRFTWADSTNGKGVIYYMKDEYNNECPYDFKNIQFKRKLNDDGTLNTTSGTDTWCYTFGGKHRDRSISQEGFEPFIENSIGASKTNPYDSNSPFTLPNTVFLSLDDSEASVTQRNKLSFNCRTNTFGPGCSDNMLESNCEQNTFSSGCRWSNFGLHCTQNSLGENCQVVSLGASCKNNIFGCGVHAIKLGDCSDSNTIGDFCQYITFGVYAFKNTLGQKCRESSFGNDCASMTLQEECERNSFGDGCKGNSLGRECNYNVFSQNSTFNQLGNFCDSNRFDSSTADNTLGDYCGDNEFGVGVIHVNLDGPVRNPYLAHTGAGNGHISYCSIAPSSCYINIIKPSGVTNASALMVCPGLRGTQSAALTITTPSDGKSRIYQRAGSVESITVS